MNINFAKEPLRTTPKATLHDLGDGKTTWVPNQFCIGGGEYELPNDFRFTVNHGITRKVSFYIGVELAEEFDAVEEFEE